MLNTRTRWSSGLRREIQVILPGFLWVLHLLISKEAWVQIPLVSSFDNCDAISLF